MTPDPVRAFDVEWSVATGAQVAVTFRPAGPLPRLLAYLLDLAIRTSVLVAVGILLALAGATFGLGLWLLLLFAMEWAYGVILEARWHGRTVGKRVLGLRVIGADGLPAGWGQCALRNVLRTADWLPVGFAAGLTAMLLSGGFRRLGDLAAGTLVVYDDHGAAVALPQMKDAAVLALARALPGQTANLLSPGTARALSAYAARREQFSLKRRQEMAAHLALPLALRLGLTEPPDCDRFLTAVHLLRFHGRPAAAGAATAAVAGGAAAITMTKRRQEWRALETLLSAKPSAPRAVELAHAYRAVCSDLALAESQHLPADAVRYLHDLAARAHLRFHRRLGEGWRTLTRTLLVEAPARLFTDPCLRIAGVAFFGVFALATVLAAWRHDLAAAFLGQEFLDSMRNMYEAAPHGREADESMQMAGYYVRNNVGIGLACFATGIFVGLGSLVTLVYNGIVLGLVHGYLMTVDASVRAHFLEFVSAHGAFELSGIACAGAAGLRMGWGLVDCRGLTRSESLRRAANRAVPMLGAAATLIAMAAPIEAFVSPSSLPFAAKIGVGVTCALLVALWLIGLGWRGSRLLAIEAAAKEHDRAESIGAA